MRPNILMIMADQLPVACLGPTDIRSSSPLTSIVWPNVAYCLNRPTAIRQSVHPHEPACAREDTSVKSEPLTMGPTFSPALPP